MNPLVRLYPGDQAVVVVATTLVLATVVIFAAFLLSHIAARHNAATRSALWLCALLCVLLGPLVTFGLQRAGVSIVQVPLYTPFATAASLAPIGNFAPASALPDSTPVEVGPRDLTTLPAYRSAEAEGLSPVANRSGLQPGGDLWRATVGIVVGIWVLGLLAHVARFLFGYRSLLILRRDVQPIDERLDRVRDAVRRALGTGPLPRIVTSTRVTCPLAAGGPVRPLVILPDTLLPDLDDEQLRDILIHECAHVVQHDFFVGMAQRLAEMVYWPYPPVRHLNRELTAAREEICDNYVLRHSDGPRYARTLLKLSHAVPAATTPVGACGSLDSGTTLETRIARLLDDRRKPMTQMNGWMRTVIAVAFMAMMTLIAGTRIVRANPADATRSVSEVTDATGIAPGRPTNTQDGPDEAPAPDPAPGVTARSQPDELQATIDAIKEKASLEFDEESPDRPVVTVHLGKGIEDDSFVELIEHLRKLPKLRKLAFWFANITEARVARLRELRNVETITIFDSPITDAGLAHLKDLPNLKKLTLEGDSAAKITEAGFAHLRNLSQLDDLQLDLRRVTDEDLKGLEGLTSLKKLTIRSEDVTSAGMVHLRGLINLQRLNLIRTFVGEAGLEHLKDLPNLRSLHISGDATRGWYRREDKQVTSGGLAHIKHMTKLKELGLVNTLVDDDGLVHLKDLGNLEDLRLAANLGITDAGLVHLRGLTDLRTLHLYSTSITDAGLVHLKSLTKLKSLNLSGTKVTDAGLVHLKGLVSLELLTLGGQMVPTLNLGTMNITDAGVAHLKGLSNLRSLTLSGTKITDAGMVHLSGLTNLEKLWFEYTQITGVGFAHLKPLRKLRWLGCWRAQIDDAGLAHLKEMPNLERVGVQHTQITDAGLTHLANMTSLTNISFNGTRITDAGLNSLYGLSNLGLVELKDTGVTDAGIEKLQNALPKAKIRR